MIEIEIRNFQAIDDLKVTVEGFTALVGRSNIGKSSIVRALKCALSGSSGTDFVRHNSKECGRLLTGAKTCKCFAAVKLTFGEGQALLWEKGSRGVNRYTVWRDGVQAVYDRVGQGMDLPEVLAANFAPVKVGPSEALLQVSSQFDPPFLLDLSGPAVASVLSDIGQLDEINQALAAVAKDRRTAAARRKVREEDASGLTERLKAYDGLDDHLQRVATIQTMAQQVETLQKRSVLAGRLIAEVSEAATILRRVAAAAEARPPDARPFQSLGERQRRAARLLSDFDARASAFQALKRALLPPMPELGTLRLVWARRAAIAGFERGVTERLALVQRLEKCTSRQVPDTLGEIQGRAKALQRLEGWLSSVERAAVTLAKASQLQTVGLPEADHLKRAMSRLAELTRLGVHHDRVSRELAQSERELADATREVQTTRQQFALLGLCPTCHQRIAAEHVAHA